MCTDGYACNTSNEYLYRVKGVQANYGLVYIILPYNLENTGR